MARSLNKVLLIGNLGSDPETRFTPNQNAVTNFSVATSDSWRDKTTGEQQTRTEWHRVVCFNNLANIAGQYLKKGSKIYLEGNLRTRKWEDKNGMERYTTEVIMNEMVMLDRREDGPQGGNMGQRDGGSRVFEGSNTSPNTAAASNNQDTVGFDDDIPF